MISRKIPCKVLDKRFKDGPFGRSYYVTLKILSTSEYPDSPVVTVTDPVSENKVGINTYYGMDVGEVYLVVWHQTETGKWSLREPSS